MAFYRRICDGKQHRDCQASKHTRQGNYTSIGRTFNTNPVCTATVSSA